jgi:hypothetical protein
MIAFIALISIATVVVVIFFSGNETLNGVPNNGTPAVSSLQFKVTETYNSQTLEITFMAKNLNTGDKKIMGTANDDEYGFIVNNEIHKIWELRDGEWVEIPDEEFEMAYTYFSNLYNQYENMVKENNYENFTFNEPEVGVELNIYDIQVNTTIDNSLFLGE